MMDNGTAKRMRVTTQNADTLAVCHNCGQSSSNLFNCDNCGCPLSDDNASLFGRTDPKHARMSEGVVNGGGVGGRAVPQSLFFNSTVSAAASAAAPGASFTLANAIASGRSQVRPRTLYVNINNQTTLDGTTSPTTLHVSSALPPLPAAPPGLQTAPPASSTYLAADGGGGVTMVRSLSGQPTTCLAKSATTVEAVVANSTTTFSSLPPPPLSYPANPSVAIGQLSSVLPGASAAVVKISASAPALTTAAVAPPAAAPAPCSVDEVSITAYQIRIGTHKFLPISPVTFKDDGILFTLKGYTHAPVLLNARAIMICKANLIFNHYPVLFLYLESSCMRQIRGIFSLKDDEFCDNSVYPLKRCITIFPNATSLELDERDTSQAIVAMFTSMSRKYPSLSRSSPRYSKILYLLSPEVALDMLLALPADDVAADSLPVASRSAAANKAATAVTACQPLTVCQPATAAAATAPYTLATSQHLTHVSTSTPPATLGNNLVVTQQKSTPLNILTGSSGVSPPVLQVPSDMGRWLQMQKSLVVGGVYHAQLPAGQRKYCLWNGSQLVPCLVQNTEVQVECSHARIGTHMAKCVSRLRVKVDPPSGIFFSIHSDISGVQNVVLSQNDISHCLMYADKGFALIFVHTTVPGAALIRHTCKLACSGPGPVYNQASMDDAQKHIVLFINKLNSDQKEALLQMKCPGHVTKRMFESINVGHAYRTLQRMYQRTHGDTYRAMGDVLPKAIVFPAKLEELVKQILEGNVTNEALSAGSDAATAAAVDDDDDDDDDVIMTCEEIGVKCPYTQQVMKEPTRNTLCGHNYERAAIVEFIVRRKGLAKCPYTGCGNTTPLKMDHLEENTQLKAYIAEQKQKAESEKT